MKLKSYFTNTVEDAMVMARQELGADAMLVNSRKSSPDARHLGVYEVVFVTDAPGVESEEPPMATSMRRPTSDRLTQQMTEFKKELEGMRRTITHSALAQAVGQDVSQDGSDAYQALTASEVTPELAREIIHAAEARSDNSLSPKLRALKRPEGGAFRRALAEELESRFTVQATLGRGEARPRIVGLPR